MKKLLLLTILVIITAVCGFAQVFDNLPYSNPDAMTYFQQEMKSLFQFMSEYNLNIPVYASWSGKFGSKGKYSLYF